MRRRPIPRPQSLTSLIDVLFVIVFASLVQSAAARKTAMNLDEPVSGEPVTASATPTTPDAGAADAAGAPAIDAAVPIADRVVLRTQALSALATSMATRPVLIARISRDGVLTALELPDRRVELGVPLLERVPEADVLLAYLGDRSSELQLCSIAVLRLSLVDLKEYLIVIAPDVALADLTVALVSGLQRDAERCQLAQHGAAVVVDAAMMRALPASVAPPASVVPPASALAPPSVAPAPTVPPALTDPSALTPEAP